MKVCNCHLTTKYRQSDWSCAVSFQRGAFSSPWGYSWSLWDGRARLGVFDSCDSEGVCWIVQATTRRNIVNRQSRDSSWQKSPKYAQKQRGKQAEGIQGHWHKAARHIRHIWTLLSDEGWAKMAAGATRAEVLRLHRRGAESPCGSFWLRLENLTWWFRFESWETRAATFLNEIFTPVSW